MRQKTIDSLNRLYKILVDEFGSDVVVNRYETIDIDLTGLTFAMQQITNEFKVGRGQFLVPNQDRFDNFIQRLCGKKVKNTVEKEKITVEQSTIKPVKTNKVSTISMESNLNNDLYVKFGCYDDLLSIVSDGCFFPVYITGETGFGKTEAVFQACKESGKNIIRVNIVSTTDEDDLIGNFKLIDGDTVWEDGPVIRAMKEGSVLLLDELDFGTDKILCLQGILEGKPVYVKKINEIVYPKDGFNIIATGNSKGECSDRYVYTNVLNEAFLDRFAITLHHDFPSKAVEKNIIGKYANSIGMNDKSFIEDICRWSEIIRNTFKENAVSELISTRRLKSIVQTYKIFSDPQKSIQLNINRFDASIQNSFLDLYLKIKNPDKV